MRLSCNFRQWQQVGRTVKKGERRLDSGSGHAQKGR